MKKTTMSYSERKEKLNQMRHGRIEKSYLTELVLEYKMSKVVNPQHPMPEELAEVILIIIDKMLGSGNWRNYTDDWKEEMRGRAVEHVLRYTQNFDPVKSNDPYNYFAMVISNAFIQSWRKCKNWTDQNVILNHELMHSDNNWDGESDGETNPVGRIPNTDSLDWGHFEG